MNLADLTEAAHDADGVAPFNEATTLALAAGAEPRYSVIDGHGAVLGFGDDPVELVVRPDERRTGHGHRLLAEAIEAGETRFWAHGDLPAAQTLAASAGLSAVRTLLVLRRGVDAVQVRELDGVVIRAAVEADTDAIVAVNGRAFTSHPEQGAMDRADFERRAASDWFDWDGLFVAERDGEVVGFHWTKIEDGIGEVYVVGVDPTQQGTGLGTALTARGLQHLVDAGVEAIDLYVEGDNEPALAVYRRLGFSEHAKDVLYAVS